LREIKKIRWGIIGLGKIAHSFAHDLQLVEGNELSAVASRRLGKAELFAEKYQVKKAYGSYAEILKDDDIDIIYVATPHISHMEFSIAAMESGKHVLCEKPLAVNAQQVQKMILSSKENNVFLMEAFWSRFNPAIGEVFRLIKKGTIGEVNYVNADFSFYTNASYSSRLMNIELAGGALLDIGIYPIFLAYSIFGMPEQVSATSRFHPTGVDVQTAALLKYKNGIANLMCGFKSSSDMVAKIYGTKGSIFIDSIWHMAQGFTVDINNEKKHYSFPTKGNGLIYEIEECNRCILANQLESPNWTHQNSLDIISITDEIRKQTGIKYPFESQ
jgi:predicted dehydrogenase